MTYLAIVPTLSLGQARLKNAVFWVAPDTQLGVESPGILGIDLLLKFQTLRWNSSNLVEIGFPPQAKNSQEANLYFEDYDLITEVSSDGHDSLSFVLDTGNTDSTLLSLFASRSLDLVAANGRQANFELHGEAGHSRLRETVVPEVKLRVGGMETTLRDADVLLEKAALWESSKHGVIGINIVNRALTVTLDFRAMRLTLEAPSAAR
jgi:hypothetical protein